jgi:type IX secretion system PorP/SprF family membrane protein
MTTKTILKSVFAYLVLHNLVIAQDIHFSQYAETPSSINPALVGVMYDTRVIVNYKSQWSNVVSSTNKYETMAFSFEQAIKHKKLKDNYFAVSANIFKESAGDASLKSLNPNFAISYLQKVNKQMKLSGGLQSGFFYRTIDVSKMRWDEQYNGYVYDSSLPSGELNVPRSSITSFDVGGGVNLNYIQSDRFLSSKDAAKFDVGISAYHYSLGRSSFISSSEKLQTRVCAYFNGDFNIPNSKNAIMPSFLYMRQGSNSQFIAGALFKFILGDQSTYTGNKKAYALSLGAFYRYRDAIVPSVLVQYNKYAIGISYDVNISALTPASNKRGGLEVMMRYNIFPGYGRNMGRSDTKPSY